MVPIIVACPPREIIRLVNANLGSALGLQDPECPKGTNRV